MEHSMGRCQAIINGRRSLVAALAIVVFETACMSPCNIQSQAAISAGAGAVDCGHVPLNDSDSRAASNACVATEFSGASSFWVSYDRGGIDSHPQEAFVRTAEGAVQVL